MSLLLQVIQAHEVDEILEFENKKLGETINDETERTFFGWTSKWRKESLEHYLPMGWSFSARDNEGQLVGYFLAQPLLFIDGQTQSLWVEHIQFNSLQVRDELCELAYKLSRDKHLQKVYLPQSQAIENSVKSMKADIWNPQTLVIKTTRSL